MMISSSESTASSLLRVENITSHTELVKTDFNRRIELAALPVETSKLQSCITTLRKLGPGFVKLATIVEGQTPDHKLVLLDPQLVKNHKSVLNTDELEALEKCGVQLNDPNSLESQHLDVTYENFPYSAVLSSLLPPDVPLSSFSIVGHIAHLNLTEHTLPYGKLIAEVLVSKFANIKTVVNKRKQISSVYRTFELDLLAGVPDYVTVHKEFGIEFELDFSQVYWNSRLSTEHKRVAKQFRPGDLVFDLCAGVGPFAVPALKLMAEVHANDLNPTAYRYLEANLRRNLKKSLHDGRIHAYNMDARQFIQQVFAPRYLAGPPAGDGRVFAIANLPAAAVDMLDAFIGCCSGVKPGASGSGDDAPLVASLPPVKIFCYSFVRRTSLGQQARADAEAELFARVKAKLSGCVADEAITLRYVRDVATSKDMYCVEIACPSRLLLDSTRLSPDAPECQKNDDESNSKRPRFDSK